ncbi:MAG: 3'-5' exonuclease [Alphaproteobacteria bacterium]|nr:3'-5' exonuclease [Alphaproteobacteria bacterium]
MRFKHLPIIAFDTETTGLAAFDGDKIIEVGIVKLELDPSGEVVAREDFSQLVNPGIPIPRKATEITGIRDADVANAPTFPEIAQTIYEWLGSGIAVAHNFPFDRGFLEQELRNAELFWPEPIAEVDTVDLSMKVFQDPDGQRVSHKLGDLARRCGVELENAHRATDDAAACGLCFAHLLRRAEVDDDLQALLDWANAIGRPPEDGPIQPGENGRLVFVDGKHAGKPVEEHPLHLHWMTKARRVGPNGWQWRYSDSVRRWAKRWLDIRGSGRAVGGAKSLHPDTWSLDSCIAPPQVGV